MNDVILKQLSLQHFCFLFILKWFQEYFKFKETQGGLWPKKKMKLDCQRSMHLPHWNVTTLLTSKLAVMKDIF